MRRKIDRAQAKEQRKGKESPTPWKDSKPRIAIMGYSGSGKSTLCRKLAERYHVPAFHFDQVQFLAGWQERASEDKQRMVTEFLDRNTDGWVMDGNYSKLSFERRVEEADLIILMLFSRWNCLWRCMRRYRTYQGTSRPDIAEGCNEKLDWEFVRWILWEGRTKAVRERYRKLQQMYPQKVVVLKNQRQIDRFLRE